MKTQPCNSLILSTNEEAKIKNDFLWILRVQELSKRKELKNMNKNMHQALLKNQKRKW